MKADNQEEKEFNHKIEDFVDKTWSSFECPHWEKRFNPFKNTAEPSLIDLLHFCVKKSEDRYPLANDILFNEKVENFKELNRLVHNLFKISWYNCSLLINNLLRFRCVLVQQFIYTNTYLFQTYYKTELAYIKRFFSWLAFDSYTLLPLTV